MAYQTIPPAATTDWIQRTQARVKLMDSTLTRPPVTTYGTNITSDMLLGAGAGTGAVNALTTQIEGGGIECTSGGTAGGSRVANLGVSSTVAKFAANSRTSHWAVYVKAKIVTAVASGAETAPICCLIDTSTDHYLGMAAATSTANWVLSVNGVGADTGVALDTSWHELLLRNDGTTVRAYIDWAQVSSAAASGLATTAGWPRMYANNAAVNGTVNFYVNRWAMFTSEP